MAYLYHTWRTLNKYNPYITFCSGSGLPDSGILHDKFLVIDDRVVITGSMNWNSNSIEDNRENIVVIESEELARAYTLEFRNIWKDKQRNPCPPAGF
jgi:phosphatidylserine/phosphatidylglycerophosphate/cardiolipin synthase-like enzyme